MEEWMYNSTILDLSSTSSKVKKVYIILVLNLIKHYAMKAYGGVDV
jgi:hypothetical protein